MNPVATTKDEALQCPFCGQQPTIEHWHGGGPQKRLVSCDNDDCSVQPSVAGTTERKALAAWNNRVPPNVGGNPRERSAAK